MTAQIIDGKTYAAGLRQRIAGHVARLKADNGVIPGLAVVIVGHDPASEVYVSQKAKQTVEVGMHSEKYELPEETPEAEVLAGMRVAEPEDMEEAARRIHALIKQLRAKILYIWIVATNVHRP